ncbi:hypothetical protein HOLleu_22770 [Holothuria leucospilota]|uniref:Uncharacterized protein n=1 Tax=Holothuria leucospilota TaxID=206669 RepID=A0A9Q1BU83_HOLLE|nr:hypothetical protein HOLleu_22770 [Holothuria leucospilota]
MVFGTTLRFPGQFFDKPDDSPLLDPSNYVHRLKSAMTSLIPTSPRVPTNRATHVNANLNTCTHVFIRRDTFRKPLQPPYDGPFKVLERNDKVFKLDVNGRHETLSIDRLKAAHFEPEVDGPITDHSDPAPTVSTTTSPSTTTKPVRITRSGRRVHWPKRPLHTTATCKFIMHPFLYLVSITRFFFNFSGL